MDSNRYILINPQQNQISLSDAYAVQYWTEELGVSPAELQEAVEIMGSSPDKVRRYLN